MVVQEQIDKIFTFNLPWLSTCKIKTSPSNIKEAKINFWISSQSSLSSVKWVFVHKSHCVCASLLSVNSIRIHSVPRTPSCSTLLAPDKRTKKIIGLKAIVSVIQDPDKIKLEEIISTKRNREDRRNILFKSENSLIHTSIKEIIKGVYDNRYSLVTFKPSQIIGFEWEKVSKNEKKIEEKKN